MNYSAIFKPIEDNAIKKAIIQLMQRSVNLDYTKISQSFQQNLCVSSY